MNIEQRLARSQRLIDGSKLLIEQSSIRLLGRPEHALPVFSSLGRLMLMEQFGLDGYRAWRR